jgi:nitroreductase
MFDQLKNLFQNRRTVRYASSADIPEDDIKKLIDVTQLAPSSDKAFCYKVYALTNSPEAIERKTGLVEFARCGIDMPGDTFHNREINLSLLSGLVFYFTIPEVRLDIRPKSKNYAIIDATINATMIMMTAEAMGYKTAFSAVITDRPDSRKILTGGTEEEIILAVSVSVPRDYEIPESMKDKTPVRFKGQIPYIKSNKHLSIKKTASVTII